MSTTVELDTAHFPIVRVRFGSEKGIQILSRATLEQLSEIISNIELEPEVRIVLFEGTGRTFLAGAELSELKQLTVATAKQYSRLGQRLFSRIESLPALTISAPHAACAGGGCELSLACDFRWGCAETRIGLPEVTLGLIPGWGGTVRSVEKLGARVAGRLMLTGELLPGDEAFRVGLLDALLPSESFAESVLAKSRDLLRAGPHAVRRIKQQLRALAFPDRRELFRNESRLFARCYKTSEPAAGVDAFLAKQPAPWVNVAVGGPSDTATNPASPTSDAPSTGGATSGAGSK